VRDVTTTSFHSIVDFVENAFDETQQYAPSCAEEMAEAHSQMDAYVALILGTASSACLCAACSAGWRSPACVPAHAYAYDSPCAQMVPAILEWVMIILMIGAGVGAITLAAQPVVAVTAVSGQLFSVLVNNDKYGRWSSLDMVGILLSLAGAVGVLLVELPAAPTPDYEQYIAAFYSVRFALVAQVGA
jgi:hypothetical protein